MNEYGDQGALKPMFHEGVMVPLSSLDLVSVFLSFPLGFPWGLGQLSWVVVILGPLDNCFGFLRLAILNKGPPRVPIPLVSNFSSLPPLPSFLCGVVRFLVGRRSFRWALSTFFLGNQNATRCTISVWKEGSLSQPSLLTREISFSH